jgi:hypothetical protein
LAKYFDEASLAAKYLYFSTASLSFYIKLLASTVPLQQNLAKYFVETSLAAKYLHFSPASLSFHIKLLASTIPLQQNLAKNFDETSLAAALLLSHSLHIKPLSAVHSIPLQQNLPKYFVETSLAAKYLHFRPASLSFHIKPVQYLCNTIWQNIFVNPPWLQNNFTLDLLLFLIISNR